MLSEIAIDDAKSFTKLVEIAKDALAGKKIKVEAPKVEVKKEEKKETKTTKKEVKEDLTKLTVAELKKLAKEKNIANYTTMKKAELLDALK